jgi:hypothetical protein
VTSSVSEIPGLRIFYRLGGDNLLRFSALVFWIGILAWVPLLLRPDLIRPADVGSDTSNWTGTRSIPSNRAIDPFRRTIRPNGQAPCCRRRPSRRPGPYLAGFRHRSSSI